MVRLALARAPLTQAEDPERDILVGLLRLRKCSAEGTFRPELLSAGQTSLVREVRCHLRPS